MWSYLIAQEHVFIGTYDECLDWIKENVTEPQMRYYSPSGETMVFLNGIPMTCKHCYSYTLFRIF